MRTLIALIALACHTPRPLADAAEAAPAPAGPPVDLARALDDATVEAARGLAHIIDDDARLPRSLRRDAERGDQYLWMAAHAASPDAAAAGLEAMAQVFTYSRYFPDRPRVDDDYRRVVRARLEATDRRVLGRAIGAAAAALEGNDPDLEIAARLAALSDGGDSATRIESLAALRKLKGWWRERAVVPAVGDALDDPDPAVQHAALALLAAAGDTPEERVVFRARLEGFLAHEDPILRARAVELLGWGVYAAGERACALVPLLADPAPRVRAEAAEALAHPRSAATIPYLAPLFADAASTEASFAPAETLDGQARTGPPAANAFRRVDYAALSALQRLSGRMAEPFTFRVSYRSVGEDLAAASEAAGAWMAAFGTMEGGCGG